MFNLRVVSLVMLLFLMVSCGRTVKKELPLDPNGKGSDENSEKLSETSEVPINKPESKSKGRYAGEAVRGLNLREVGDLSKEEIELIPLEQIPELTHEQIRALSWEQLSYFLPAQMSYFTVRQYLDLDPCRFGAFTGDQLASLPLDIFKALKTHSIESLLFRHLKKLKVEQIRILIEIVQNHYNKYGLSLMGSHVLNHLSPEQFQAAGPDLYNLILWSYRYRSEGFLNFLMVDQISALPDYVLSRIPLEHLQQLSRDQIMAFTRIQIQKLSPRVQLYMYTVRPDTYVPEPRSGTHYGSWTPGGPVSQAPRRQIEYRPKKSALLRFMQSYAPDGYRCSLIEQDQEINFGQIKRERNKIFLKMRPDKNSSTALAQDFNHLWDEFLAENELLGQ